MKIGVIGVGNMATATLIGITPGYNAVAVWSDIIL